MELNLEDEATLEGTVEVARQVGGGDKDAIKVFNLLQDDVLHGIVHLVDGVLDVLRALVDEGIGLVEEEDGLHLTVATEVAIVLEDGLDVLLALTNILVTHAGDVHLHEVATSLTGYLQYGLGLSRARSSVEEAGKALAHALLLEALLDVGEVVCRKQTGEAVNLLLLGLIEEEGLLLDGVMALQETVAHTLLHALALLVTGLIVREEFGLALVCQHILFVVGHAVDTLVLDVATSHKWVVTVAQFLAHEITLELLRIDVADGVEGQALTIGTFPLGVVVDNHQQQRLDVDVIVEPQNLLAEREVRVGLTQHQHPLLNVAEVDAAVVHVLVEVALEFVDELLFGESVNFLGHKGLVMAQSRNQPACQPESLEEIAKLAAGFADEPALLDHLLYLLSVGHYLQTGAVEEVAHLLP